MCLLHAFLAATFCQDQVFSIKVRLVQNAGTRVIDGATKFQNITTILLSLLPVEYFIFIKTLVFFLAGTAPSYLVSLFKNIPPQSPYSLCYWFQEPIVFAVLAPKFWNNLPSGIWFLESFKAKLFYHYSVLVSK